MSLSFHSSMSSLNGLLKGENLGRYDSVQAIPPKPPLAGLLGSLLHRLCHNNLFVQNGHDLTTVAPVRSRSFL